MFTKVNFRKFELLLRPCNVFSIEVWTRVFTRSLLMFFFEIVFSKVRMSSFLKLVQSMPRFYSLTVIRRLACLAAGFGQRFRFAGQERACNCHGTRRFRRCAGSGLDVQSRCCAEAEATRSDAKSAGSKPKSNKSIDSLQIQTCNSSCLTTACKKNKFYDKLSCWPGLLAR